jgi:hypothetical protein
MTPAGTPHPAGGEEGAPLRSGAPPLSDRNHRATSRAAAAGTSSAPQLGFRGLRPTSLPPSPSSKIAERARHRVERNSLRRSTKAQDVEHLQLSRECMVSKAQVLVPRQLARAGCQSSLLWQGLKVASCGRSRARARREWDVTGPQRWANHPALVPGRSTGAGRRWRGVVHGNLLI